MSGRRRMMGGANGGFDLSYMDIHGNVTATQNTANCYVISKPGTYKFPLVYGNGIKNGAVNSNAYTLLNNYGKVFVNHAGNTITSPYIEVAGGTATSAGVVNTDTSGVIDNVKIISGSSCRYISFEVTSVPDKGANSIIGVQNSSNVCMWSWHIWVWPDDLTPVTFAGSQWMPVNLASLKDDNSNLVNWFYQWGRKDPLLPAASVGSMYNHVGGALLYDEEYTVAKSIQDPRYFLGDISYAFSEVGVNYWDSTVSTSTHTKTVYDPSPVGYMVPYDYHNNCYIAEVTNVSVILDDFSGSRLTYYMTGYRQPSYEYILNTPEYAYLYRSFASGYNHYLKIYARDTQESTDGAFSSYEAASVRPVKET